MGLFKLRRHDFRFKIFTYTVIYMILNLVLFTMSGCWRAFLNIVQIFQLSLLGKDTSQWNSKILT